MKDQDAAKPLAHWWILVLGILAAIGIWVIWLGGGMDLARGVVEKRAIARTAMPGIETNASSCEPSGGNAAVALG